uniref:Uncharacterized protein n=1 Tax=Aegilops tauschii subsp. strangulata TaxID=200361 RepID=A0A452XUC8_AEGTS
MVHKFLNQCNIPWVHLIWESYYQNSLPPGENAQCSFWWKDCLKLLDTYKLHSSCTPGSGGSLRTISGDAWSAAKLPHSGSK